MHGGGLRHPHNHPWYPHIHNIASSTQRQRWIQFRHLSSTNDGAEEENQYAVATIPPNTQHTQRPFHILPALSLIDSTRHLCTLQSILLQLPSYYDNIRLFGIELSSLQFTREARASASLWRRLFYLQARIELKFLGENSHVVVVLWRRRVVLFYCEREWVKEREWERVNAHFVKEFHCTAAFQCGTLYPSNQSSCCCSTPAAFSPPKHPPLYNVRVLEGVRRK